MKMQCQKDAVLHTFSSASFPAMNQQTLQLLYLLKNSITSNITAMFYITTTHLNGLENVKNKNFGSVTYQQLGNAFTEETNLKV